MKLYLRRVPFPVLRWNWHPVPAGQSASRSAVVGFSLQGKSCSCPGFPFAARRTSATSVGQVAAGSPVGRGALLAAALSSMLGQSPTAADAAAAATTVGAPIV